MALGSHAGYTSVRVVYRSVSTHSREEDRGETRTTGQKRKPYAAMAGYAWLDGGGILSLSIATGLLVF